MFFLLLFRRALDRRLQFLAQCREEPSHEMFGDAAQNPLTDAGDQPADFTRALEGQTRGVGAVRRNLEPRAAVTMPQRAGAGNLDLAGFRRLLVRQRNLAFERTAD